MKENLSAAILGYLLKRPISHKLKIEAMLKENFGIHIPLLFGGDKKNAFKDFSNAVYIVSTEALLLDAAIALEKYFDEDRIKISNAAFDIFEGFAGKSQLIQALHIGVCQSFVEIKDPKETPIFTVTKSLYSEWVPYGVSQLRSLQASYPTPIGNYYQEIRSMLSEESSRVFLDAIQKTDTNFMYSPLAYAQMEADVMNAILKGFV